MVEDKQTRESRGEMPKHVRVKLIPEVEAARSIPAEASPRGLGIPDLDEVLSALGLQRADLPKPRKLERLTGVRQRWYNLEFPPNVDIDEVAKILQRIPAIEAVDIEQEGGVAATPNDVSLGWHLTTIEAEDAWDRSMGNDVRIAVVDTGVDRNHEDLNDHWDGGDTTRNGAHGTNVAGICAAETNNNQGVAGVGWNAHLLGYDSSTSATTVSSSRTANDIEQAVDDDASVINISLWFTFPSSGIENALEYAFKAGVVIVTSAGNATSPIPWTCYPAAFDNYAISVGRTNNDDSRNATSNYGDWLDVMAPGTSLPTTGPGNAYPNFSGTSAASPVVAGIAALIKAANHTLGPRQVKEIFRQTTEIPLGTNISNNRYGNGRVNARKALLASQDLWKTVRYSNVPKVGASVAASDNGWWIVAYSKSVFVGYKTSYWKKMVSYGSVANAEPAVAINDDGDWIVNYSRSTFVGHRTSSVAKMVSYPRRDTRGTVAINQNGDWIVVYSVSTFVGYKTASAVKMVSYNSVPHVPGNVAINADGDWICCYSKSTFVGRKTTTTAKKVYYNAVANAAATVDINDNGDWIVNYSKSTFVGYKTSAASKMVYYAKRSIPGDVGINSNGDWICCYSKSTFVGHKTISAVKKVYYNAVANAAASVDINENGDWIVNYSKSTFVGYKTSAASKMVTYPKRDIAGSVAINQHGDWIAVYSISTFVGYKTSWASKRVYYNSVPKTPGSVDINDNGDWIVNYSRTTFLGRWTSSTIKAVKYAPDDMSRDDIRNGFSYPSSTLPSSRGEVAINNAGDWVGCYGRSSSVGGRELYTNTHSL